MVVDFAESGQAIDLSIQRAGHFFLSLRDNLVGLDLSQAFGGLEHLGKQHVLHLPGVRQAIVGSVFQHGRFDLGRVEVVGPGIRRKSLFRDLLQPVIDDHSDRMERQKPVDVPSAGSDRIQHEYRLNPEAGLFGFGPNRQATVAGFGTEDQIQAAADHRMIPGQKGDVFPGQGPPPIESALQSVPRNKREGVGDGAGGIEPIGSRSQFFDLDSEVIEHPGHERVERIVPVVGFDLPLQKQGGGPPEGIQFQQPVATFVQPF